jgi:hypothetical protein
MDGSWKIPKLKVNGDTFVWYQQNRLLISKIFLLFSESIESKNKWPIDVVELLHTDFCEYSVIITIHSKENMESVLKRCEEVFVEHEEYEMAQRSKNIQNSDK